MTICTFLSHDFVNLDAVVCASHRRASSIILRTTCIRYQIHVVRMDNSIKYFLCLTTYFYLTIHHHLLIISSVLFD